MKEIVLFVIICLSLIDVRAQNGCKTERFAPSFGLENLVPKLGLLAPIFGRNAVSGESTGDGKVEAAQLKMCCINPDEISTCPLVENTNDDNDDNGFGFDFTPKVASLKKQVEERLCPVINEKPWKSCTYKKSDFTPEIERQCTTTEKLNEFTLCQQGCNERFPSQIPGVTSTDDGLDMVEIALIGDRTDAIGGKNEKRCGVRKFELTALPENEAIMGEFPWVCSVFTRTPRNRAGRYLGGCAIIPNGPDNDIHKPTYRVITAAAKIELANDEPLLVRIRFVDRRLDNIENDFVVSQFKVHPQYKDENFHPIANNIATLALAKPINLVQEDGVNAACLPACNDMFYHTFINGTGVRCWSAGFGVKEENGQENFVLRKVDLPIFPNKTECEDIINDAIQELPGNEGRRLKRAILNDGEICAGGEIGKDTCSGDGGSPLVCKSATGRWHVVGLTSWGIGCGVEGRPSMYTNVYHYLDFIYSLDVPT